MAFSKQRRLVTPLKGVNFGGWLVLEPWITPNLFKGTGALDEYSYCLQANTAAKERLKGFRDSFITEQDFVWLANQGIDAVRLPVGYWLFGDQEPYMETVSYVDRVFSWAQKHGLSVLLDLHGVPGSQNGEMHSGKAGTVDWAEAQHVAHTLEVLSRIARRYGNHPALLGISLLNEPAADMPVKVVEQFYMDAYDLVRKHCRADVWVVCSDSFRPRVWRRRLPAKMYPGLYIDHHHYQLFGLLDRLLSIRAQLWRSRHALPSKLRRMNARHPILIGEWSLALPAQKMRGHDRLPIAKQYAKAQLTALDTSAAWFFWTYKNEGNSLWSFRDCMESGLLELT